MSGFTPVLFDLDGTVADTYGGIVAAVAEVLGALGLPSVDRRTVEALTGKGVEALVRGVLANVAPTADDALVRTAVARYRETYARTCADGTWTYPQMPELLARLEGPLALLTNKARPFTDRILDRLGLAARFQVVVAGDDPGMRLKPDPWSIHEALRRLERGPELAILVGDTASDVQAAAAAGIPSCWVGWGHGGARSGEGGRAGATWTVGSVPELEALLATGPVRSRDRR